MPTLRRSGSSLRTGKQLQAKRRARGLFGLCVRRFSYKFLFGNFEYQNSFDYFNTQRNHAQLYSKKLHIQANVKYIAGSHFPSETVRCFSFLLKK